MLGALQRAEIFDRHYARHSSIESVELRTELAAVPGRGNPSRVACEAVRQAFEMEHVGLGGDLEGLHANVEEFIDVGDRVVLLQHELRRGRGSGVEVESETGGPLRPA